MNAADYDDIKRVLPDAPDNTIVDILAVAPTLDELEGVAILLADHDEGLKRLRREHGERIMQLVKILNDADLQSAIESDPES